MNVKGDTIQSIIALYQLGCSSWREKNSNISLMALSYLIQELIWMSSPSSLIFWVLLNHPSWRHLTPFGSRPLIALPLSLNCFSLVGLTPLNHVLKTFLSVLKVHQSSFSASCGVETPGVPRSSVGAVFLDALQHPLASPGGCQPISSCFWLGG